LELSQQLNAVKSSWMTVEAETVSEMLVYNAILIWLITRGDFIAF
jgi:hypothetical protein